MQERVCCEIRFTGMTCHNHYRERKSAPDMFLLLITAGSGSWRRALRQMSQIALAMASAAEVALMMLAGAMQSPRR